MIELRTIPLEQISESPYNPRRRFDPATLAELAQSIKSNGVLQPILVRPMGDAYQVIAGARRYRASALAGKSEIPAVVREMDDRAALEVAVIENLQREDVHPIEEAEGYDQLMREAGYNADQLAEKVGKSRAYIYARLKLRELSMDARDAFYEGTLDASTALLVARIPGKTLQKKAVAEIAKGYGGEPMSFRSAKELVRRNYMLNLKDATFRPADTDLLPGAGSCTECPKRTGNAPEIFDDVDNPNVCTDPKCFEEKRITHFMNLKARAEKKGIKVIAGDDAKKIMPYGENSIRGEYVSLDTVVDGSEGKTYREILGKHAPVEAVIENTALHEIKKKPLIEVATETALAAALEKAGYKPAEADPDEEDAANEWKAKNEEKQRQATVEKRWRVKLFELVREKNAARLASSGVLKNDDLLSLAENLYLRQIDTDSPVEELMEMWGMPWNEDAEREGNTNAFVETVIRQMDGAGLCLFLFDLALLGEVVVATWALEQFRPQSLLAEAARNGIDADALRVEIEREMQAAAVPDGA